MNIPSVFNYDNYRLFLRDWYNWMKEAHEGFSYRAFSMWAGFRSPNHLQLVINGKRNITRNTLPTFLKLLKLKKDEQRYFEALVNFNQTRNPESKARYLIDLSAHKKKFGDLLRHDQCKYLTRWYYPVIREMVKLSDFREDSAYLAKRLGSQIRPRHVEEAIGRLIGLKLLERAESGRLKQHQDIVTTGNETAEAAAYLYHEQMLRAAQEALRRIPHNERNFSGITFACGREDLPEIAQMINEFRKQILALLEAREKSGKKDDDVYQLGIQMFKLTAERRNL